MTRPFDPADRDLWSGGDYGAAIVLGRTHEGGAKERIAAAVRALWSHRALKAAIVGHATNMQAGAHWRWDDPPSLDDRPYTDLKRARGAFTDARLGVRPFASTIISEDEIDDEDWLYASIPLGGLLDRPGPWPGADAAWRAWRESLDATLAALALHVAAAVPIKVAAIGYEIAGILEDYETLCVEGGQRHLAYVVPEGGGYRYWPASIWA